MRRRRCRAVWPPPWDLLPLPSAHPSHLHPVRRSCWLPIAVQILIVAAVVDLVIALASGESGFGAFVEPSVIMLILVANGEALGG